MEPAALSSDVSDDSCDSEMKSMKNELMDFGLDDERLTKEEMKDLLKALKNSKSTEKEDEVARNKVADSNACGSLTTKSMKRRYLNVKDRRMPWSLLPNTLTQAEKARTLAVYIKLMSINTYLQARQSANFAVWPPPIQIVEETTRIQPVRSTRSGRSYPVHAYFDDDDSSDLDFVITKTKKRKISTSDHNGSDSIHSNKVLSLKRKPPKDEHCRPVKEAKISTDTKIEIVSSENHEKSKKDNTSIED